MKIGIKLVVIINSINSIGIGLLAGIVIFQSQREISRLADEEAYGVAVQTSEQIQSLLNEYMDTVRTLATVMEAYEEIPVQQRRDYCNLMMRQVLLANSKLQSIYANWAPNGLDGMDADYANTPGTDESGRYISMWSIVDGKPTVSAIRGYGWDVVTHWAG